MWYILRGHDFVGVVGAYGPPSADGSVTVGYGIVPEAEGQGIATEALGGLAGWLLASGRVNILEATTFERHTPSVRVLEKNGFRCVGVSPHDAVAPDGDRQGRGRLMVWRR
jgi:RimJ/RimL family protein N-acetyltransferase